MRIAIGAVAVARARAVPVEPKYVLHYDDDKDGIWDVNDSCPDQAEDKDNFQDQDGCPDPDNDGDGLADVSDGCPLARAAFNGFEDGDGCPDAIPTDSDRRSDGDTADGYRNAVTTAPSSSRAAKSSYK